MRTDGWCGFHGNIGFGFGVVDVVGIGIEFEDSSGNKRSGSEKRGSSGWLRGETLDRRKSAFPTEFIDSINRDGLWVCSAIYLLAMLPRVLNACYRLVVFEKILNTTFATT